ncbi:MAG: RecQ family zinc-binding domain-containing protein, partial [Fimbriimonadaceae bacterium]|nr:RecQ family zinc-binding domain-containing protein [Chitinophagales bacterium]
ERSKKQQTWINNKIRIIVCTNAFGMGIDKPDVRIVVHWDVPDNPEAYYQEAGRAGRDGKQAYAGLLFHAGDIADLQSFILYQYPSIEFVKNVYHALCNYLQIATGAGKDEAFDFDLIDFCTKYKWNATQTSNALKILQQHNYIYTADILNRSSTIKIIVDKETLYAFQIENKQWDAFIKMLLRVAPGVFDDFVMIYEKELAYHLSIPEKTFFEQLLFLQKQNLLIYNPAKTKPQIVFTTERLPSDNLQFDHALLQRLKTAAEKRMFAMQRYAENKSACRMQMLLEYFGEKSGRCGYCDTCVERNKLSVTEKEFDKILKWLKSELIQAPKNPETIYKLAPVRKEKLLEVLQYSKDNKIIEHTKDNILVWRG